MSGRRTDSTTQFRNAGMSYVVEEGSETEQRLIGGGGKTLAAQLDSIGSRALSAAEFSVLRVISGNCKELIRKPVYRGSRFVFIWLV